MHGHRINDGFAGGGRHGDVGRERSARVCAESGEGHGLVDSEEAGGAGSKHVFFAQRHGNGCRARCRQLQIPHFGAGVRSG